MMDFDVFISYSSKDKTAADAACAALESQGIRCWIAPRDIQAGGQYGAAIIEAIDGCRVMVLIFSANANDSQQIHREIERAASKGVPIIPVRIEEIAPTKSMEYFLGAIHWLDALTGPLENHLQQLAETVKAILQVGAAGHCTSAFDNRRGAIARNAPEAADPLLPRDRVVGRPAAVGPPSAKNSGRRAWLWPALGGTLVIALLAGGGWLYHNRELAPASGSAAPSQPAQAQAEALIPEAIPYIADNERAAVRADYLSAPDHKALAIAFRVAFITGQKDAQTAKAAALAACHSINAGLARKCELYAVGNTVVSASGRPPLPPEPWLVRNPSIERPFVSHDVPLISSADRATLEKNYPKWPKSKALAISAKRWSYYNRQDSPNEAIRRSLESCGNLSGSACIVVAVDDVFVVPIPVTMKVVGLFRPETAVAPEARDNVAKRLATATSGWNVVAIGANGRPGLGLGAAKEQDAIGSALADCGKQDQACRVIAIGPFTVESKDPGKPAR